MPKHLSNEEKLQLIQLITDYINDPNTVSEDPINEETTIEQLAESLTQTLPSDSTTSDAIAALMAACGIEMA